MTSKRNIKMYLKQKSTITAFSFLLVFVVMLIISLLPIFEHRKGVYDEFKTYEVTYIGGNDYNVTYIVDTVRVSKPHRRAIALRLEADRQRRASSPRCQRPRARSVGKVQTAPPPSRCRTHRPFRNRRQG